MRHTYFVAVIAVASLLGVGCAKQGGDSHVNAMSADACSMCAGVQKATADGKCPMCGMPASNTSHPGSVDDSTTMQKMPTTRAS